jgi:hypothetical protein
MAVSVVLGLASLAFTGEAQAAVRSRLGGLNMQSACGQGWTAKPVTGHGHEWNCEKQVPAGSRGAPGFAAIVPRFPRIAVDTWKIRIDPNAVCRQQYGGRAFALADKPAGQVRARR